MNIGQEFWYARELQAALEYKQWRRFLNVIDKAKEACLNSGNSVPEHFADVGKTSPMPNGGEKEIGDIELSRYACYLIVQNGDPRKKVIALGQTYFAVKTRQQELIEHFDDLTENQKRLAIRKEMATHNKQLVAAAKDAGVQTTTEYAKFQNYGYMGLYGGLTAQDIHERKGLKKVKRFLTTWGMKNWLLISSVPLRQKPNYAVRIYKARSRLIILIMLSEKKSEIPFNGLAALCPKIFRPLRKASNK